MSGIGILGAGAFGTALAIALARAGREVVLWARDPAAVAAMRERHEAPRLPGVRLPDGVHPTGAIAEASATDTLLLAVPMQALAGLLRQNSTLFRQKTLVACCKGIDLESGLPPHRVIARDAPEASPALLSGPSFAADIAAGLPTALTIAAADEPRAEALQRELSTPVLRLYRSTDLEGVAAGGALKNVVAIACGVVIGAGLGESARAALLTRGFAEMRRYAEARGARAETLAGLPGLGDLALTCTSEKSRNFAFGKRLGAAGRAETLATTEGIATARAVAARAREAGLEMPITELVAALVDGRVSVAQAAEKLLSRPLRPE